MNHRHFSIFMGTVLALLFFPQQQEADAFWVSKTAARSTSMLFRKHIKSLHQDPNNEVEKPKYFVSFRGGSTLASNAENAEDTKQEEVSSTAATTADTYYLIWSPGFTKKLALATILLTVVCHLSEWEYFRFFAQHSRLSFSAVVHHSDLVSNLALPLLSSSCCAIQLLINAVSTMLGAGVGCVGFNTVFGPFRPYLLAIMLVFTNTRGISSTLGSIATLVLRYAIAFLPELVFWQNKVLRARWKHRRSGGQNEAAAAGQGNEATVAVPLLRATLVVDVPTMGCVACINKIESSLRQCSPKNIDGATSWLNDDKSNNLQKNGKKGGRARIEVCAESQDELTTVTQSVIGAIEAAGFGGTSVQSLDMKN